MFKLIDATHHVLYIYKIGVIKKSTAYGIIC